MDGYPLPILAKEDTFSFFVVGCVKCHVFYSNVRLGTAGRKIPVHFYVRRYVRQARRHNCLNCCLSVPFHSHRRLHSERKTQVDGSPSRSCRRRICIAARVGGMNAEDGDELGDYGEEEYYDDSGWLGSVANVLTLTRTNVLIGILSVLLFVFVILAILAGAGRLGKSD